MRRSEWEPAWLKEGMSIVVTRGLNSECQSLVTYLLHC